MRHREGEMLNEVSDPSQTFKTGWPGQRAGSEAQEGSGEKRLGNNVLAFGRGEAQGAERVNVEQ